MVRAFASSLETFGERPARWTELPRNRFILTCPWRPDAEKLYRWKRLVTRLRMCSRAGESSATHPARSLFRRKESAGWIRRRRRRLTIARFLFDRGDEVEVQAGEEGVRFLLVSGKPLEEPIAWYGPIVMNTQQELQRAFEELEKGTFLKAAS